MRSSAGALTVALSYVVMATAWILFSDSLLQLVDPALQTRLQSIKGTAFVLVTGIGLYFLVRYHLRRRRQHEEALRRSQERFNLALIGGNDGLWDWDIASGEMYVSLRGREILGLAQQGALLPDWLELLYPEDRELARRELVRHLRGDSERLDVSYRISRQDGNRWIQVGGKAVRDESGRAVRLVGMLRDVTEQVDREQRLRQAGVMFDCTSEGMLICDVDQTILDVNNAFCKITGYEPSEVIGRQPRMLASGRHDRTFYRQLWQQLHATGRWSGEVWNRRKNGEIYPQWQNIISVKDHRGELSHYVAVFADMSVIKRNQQEIDYLAHHDPLTKLPNRLLLNERLSTAIARSRRTKGELGLLFIDLDRFKGVNDSLGHSAGDQLLQLVAQRVLQVCEESDTLARLSSDEFALLLDRDVSASQMGKLAERILRLLQKPFELSGQLLHMSASIGLALFPQDGRDGAELLKNADSAMSLAKQRGRNGYAFYTQELTELARRRLSLETDLHEAIRYNQLRVYYQLQKDLRSDCFVSLEALVRWQHPTQGLVAPNEFLPVARNAGLMSDIDEYVLNEACRQLRCWIDAGYPLKAVAVNMSGYWMERGDVFGSVSTVLRRYGLPAECLELEVTEDEVMHFNAAGVQLLDRLSELGVGLAIDDFGTGYSSLLRLKRMPVNKLKIDRGFVSDLPGSDSDSAMARAIIALGKSLQLKVIAEGVETEEQEALLSGLGCDMGQGYLFNRPLPADEIEKLLGEPGHD